MSPMNPTNGHHAGPLPARRLGVLTGGSFQDGLTVRLDPANKVLSASCV